MVKELTDRIKEAKSIFITNPTRLTVPEIEKLRRKLKESSCVYMMVKNSISKRALKEARLATLIEYIEGEVALALDKEEKPVEISKTLVDYAKDHEGFGIRGGFMDGEIISLDSIKELALLPSRNVLLTKLVYGMKSPVNQFVYILKGVLRDLVFVFDAISKSKEEKDGAREE